MMRLIGTLMLLALAAGAETREGFLNVPGGPVWYRMTGDAKGVPLLVLHGGPGGTSCPFSVLEKLPGQRVVVYDQLGSGRSGRPSDRKLWTVEHFVEELHAVRQQLGLKRMHLMGHSWGSSLAAAYVIAKGTEGIESLVLGSPLLSTPDWIRDAEELKKQLPAAVQDALRRNEAAGTTNTAEYREAEAEYTKLFVRRTRGGRNEACADSVSNRVIYEQMWGPSEFHATGSLKSFDLTNQLGRLKLPVLLMVGEFDEARPETARKYQKLIPGSQLEVIPGAAHALYSDNPSATLQALERFLKRR